MMKVLILTGTPKEEGLSVSCVQAAAAGAKKAGADTEIVELCKTSISRCHVCGDGWGTCREQHTCQFGSDGFDDVVEKMRSADKLILQTPVYWGETSDALKGFIDRTRRCEAFQQDNAISGKEVLLIAAPGGSGNGLLTCLSQMERFVQHLHAHAFDFIGVNRWNKDYKLKAIEAAAELLCKE